MIRIYILAAVLFILIVLYAIWCLNVAYPLVLDKYIERGRSWLYRPRLWNRSWKTLIRFVTTLLFAVICITAFILIWQFKEIVPPWILMGIFICFTALILFFRTSCFNFRYKQQSDTYFYIHDRIWDKSQQEGKNLSESEMSNLASFQFQNMLRDADIKRNLRKTLGTQHKLAKKGRSKKSSEV